MRVKFNDFKIIPDITSVRKEEIDDDTYFSSAYGHYISNSGLKWIDPKDGGNPSLFKHHPKLKTSSLEIGSRIHECVLQSESFELAPKIGKPNAKLGAVMDFIPDFLEDGIGLDEAIKQAALKADYYVNIINSKIDSIKETWKIYSKSLEELNKTPTNKIRRILSDKNWDTVNGCVQSCLKNKEIYDKLHPKNLYDEFVDSYFEDALFIDFIVTYQGKQCAILPFKLKIDNWTIDFDSKILTLNDLKTTRKSVNVFMKEGNSFDHYDYCRQMNVYGTVLWYYCMKYFGVSKELGWQLKTNMLVVETIPNYWSRSYYVTNEQLKLGKRHFNELMFRVAYCEMFGYDKEIEFE